MDEAKLRRIWDNGACGQCTHAHDDGFTCDAFPDGIPILIASGELDHLSPLEGDHGIPFEPVEDADDSPPEPESQCLLCHHYIRKDVGESFVCDAFMGVIPDEIWANYFDHRRPYAGDDGVRFEPLDGTPEDEVANLYHALDQVEPHRPADDRR